MRAHTQTRTTSRAAAVSFRKDPASPVGGQSLQAPPMQLRVGDTPPVQRVTITPTPATYQNATAIYGMTLGEFDEYARDQPDWANSPAPNQLSLVDRRWLQRVLEFARSPNILAGCQDIGVQALKDHGFGRQTRRLLQIYSGAVTQDRETVEIEAKSTLADALDMGRNLKKLERNPGGPVIKTIFNQAWSQASLEAMMAASAVDAFVRYVRTVRPVLQANNGKEIDSFLKFFAEVGGNPLTYHGRLRNVRNFHRFEKAGLDQLVTNQGDTSRSKPLALILHTALDHNGAFHRDSQLTSSITANPNLVLMVEGVSSLSQARGLIRPLARRYGQHRKISQVMIAGHGSPRYIGLAGSVDSQTMEERDDSINLDDPRQAARSNRFFRELLRNMEDGPDSRVVFNACLTAAQEVPEGLDDDPAIAATQINEAINNNPTLTRHLQDMADTRGQSLDVIGANASFGEGPSLMDASGRFDIIAGGGDDPELTSDKFAYARRGWEPEGALRAVLECWAQDRSRCMTEVNQRIGHPEAGNHVWDEAIIQAAYRLIRADPTNAPLINKLANSAWLISHAKLYSECKKETCGLWDLPFYLTDVQISSILSRLVTTATWTSQSYTRLVFRQFLMMQNPSSATRSNFLTELGNFNCRQGNDFVDISRIQSELGNLIPVPAGSPPNGAKLRLSLIGVIQGDIGAGAASQEYLKSVVGPGNHEFPAALGVNGLLAGIRTESDILSDIGLANAAAAAVHVGGAATIDANVDLDRDGTNEFYIEPMARRGTVSAGRLNVRANPSTSAPIVGGLARDRMVYISGRSDNWYAIDYRSQTAFVHKRYINLKPQLSGR